MKRNTSKPPLIPRLLLHLMRDYVHTYSMDEDLNEIYQTLVKSRGRFRAARWYWFQTLGSFPEYIKLTIYWRTTMFGNYLKSALRNLAKYKGFSFINTAGFSVGMACCLLIFLYVRHELSYDRYHEDAERVCRIAMDSRSQTANRLFAPVSSPVAPALKADYPQVEYAARALPVPSRLVRRDDTFFYENRFMYADQELFDVLTFQFVQGNQKGALIRPNTLVVSQRVAMKYFGHSNPLGETLEINQREYEITGVVKDSPENTHLKYDLVASLETLKDWEEMSNWFSTMFYTYLKLKPGVNVKEFSQQVGRLADKYVGDKFEKWGFTYHYFLQPLSSIHLHSHLQGEAEPPGNHVYITIFSLVGLFILIIACLNFMSLSTARAANRAKEVGLRKVVGAQKLQLIGQFLGESLLVVFLSLGLAVALASLAIPFLNELTGLSLNFATFLTPWVPIFLIIGTVLVGLAAGLYPAFVLSAFRPSVALKGILSAGTQGFILRKILVVVQFGISVMLIIGTLTMYKQFHFMKNEHLGFEKEQKLILPLRGGINIQDNFESIKDMFSKFPSITGATVSSHVPGRGTASFGISLVGEEDDRNQSMNHIYFDDDFIAEYGIDMVAGRAFQGEMKTDFMGAFLINEAAVKAFGWEHPELALGKRLKTGYGGRVSLIIGVTKDFHYRSLQSEVEPLVMEFFPSIFSYITLSLKIDDLNGTLAFVRSQWKDLWPGNPFEYFFLDTDFDRQYRADEQLGNIFGIFTFLGLFIACLGLYGLASFVTERRTKEIGIRKVLGASSPQLLLLLSRDFLKWVILANVIAWPVATYAMSKWLQNFAYHVPLSLWIYLLSGLSAFLIALIVVCSKSLRSAASNPVESLRYE